MSQRSFWKRPYLYLFAVGLFVLVGILVVGPDMAKMDWKRIASRASWQLPDRVIASLEIEPGDYVADIGAGDGYFTFRLADAVGPNGKVFAVEVDDELVEELRRKAEDKNCARVQVIKGRYEDPLLPDGELDLIFFCNSYHHIQSRPEYFDRLRRDLTSEGRVAIIDMKVSLLVRLTTPTGHWTSVETMRDEMQKANYRQVEGFDFLPAQNFALFSPRAPDVQR